jgi:hypothetical protein
VPSHLVLDQPVHQIVPAPISLGAVNERIDDLRDDAMGSIAGGPAKAAGEAAGEAAAAAMTAHAKATAASTTSRSPSEPIRVSGRPTRTTRPHGWRPPVRS